MLYHLQEEDRFLREAQQLTRTAEIPRIYKATKAVTVLTRLHYKILSIARQIHSMTSQPVSL
jgi:hypothetical protein